MTTETAGRLQMVGAWASKLLGSRTKDVQALDDGALLARSAAGEEAACRELLERHGPRLLAVVQSTHRDLGLAEDVVQETFIRAIQSADQLRSGASLFPWLVRIALRLAIDHRRKEHRAAPLDEHPDLPASDVAPDHQAQANQDAARVDAALAELDPHARELLVLRYFTNLSVRELSEVFDKSEAAVRKDLQRARGKMKRHLAPWFED